MNGRDMRILVAALIFDEEYKARRIGGILDSKKMLERTEQFASESLERARSALKFVRRAERRFAGDIKRIQSGEEE